MGKMPEAQNFLIPPRTFCVNLRRGDSNKYTKRMIHKNCSKVSVIRDVDEPTSSFFIIANLI